MRMSSPNPWMSTTAGPSPVTSYTRRAPGRSSTAVTWPPRRGTAGAPGPPPPAAATTPPLVACAVPRPRRSGPAQQAPAGRRHLVVAACGEVGGGFPQPRDRLTPAISQGCLGGQTARVLPVPGDQRPHLPVRDGERRLGVA